VPAAAVTPAPIAYIKVVAVKKLVVGCLSSAGRRRSESRVLRFTPWEPGCQSPTLFTVGQHRRSGGRWVALYRFARCFVFFPLSSSGGGGEAIARVQLTRFAPPSQSFGVPFTGCLGRPATFTLNKLECSKQVYPNA
jgi:hypothetical protein